MSKFYAVFDTNVLVSALLSKRLDSPTVLLLNLVLEGTIVLLYNEEILEEYKDVLHRDKFGFSDNRIETLMEVVGTGLNFERTDSKELFSDPDDAVFYEVALSKDGSYLGDEKELDIPALEKIGPIHRLTLEDIFGY